VRVEDSEEDVEGQCVTKLSPAKALYYRELPDFLPRPGSSLMGEIWMNLVDARETAMGRRAANAEKEWSKQTTDYLHYQNQSGNHPLRWAEGFDQFQVMVDGSRRLTRWNRRYLCLFTRFQPDMVGCSNEDQ
jgi:hypothetical protein